MSFEVTDFSVDIIAKSHVVPVLVDFWAAWCGPCKTLGPILERLASRSDGRWVLVKVDTDRNQELAAQYGIRNIPNVKLFVDGNVVNEFAGALPERAVAQWLEKALPDRFREDFVRAEEQLSSGNTEGGRVLLESVLQRDPSNEKARVLLARTFLFSHYAKAMALVEGIEEHSESFPMAEAVRTVVHLMEKGERPETLGEESVKSTYLDGIRLISVSDFDGALGRFIDVIRRNRYYDEDGSRRACIAIFRILGEEHEVTRRHRRDFGSALNI